MEERKMAATKRIEKVNDFLGYGNLETDKIIFIAIEEHGEFKDLNDYNNWDKKNISFNLNKKIFYYQKFEKSNLKNTNREQGKLAYQLLSKIFGVTSLPKKEDFLNGNIIEDFSFYSNLYPLCCNKEDCPYPIQYLDLFNIGNTIEDKWRYKNKVIERRIELFKYLIRCKLNDDPNLLFFVMGESPKIIIKNVCTELGFSFPEEFRFPRKGNDNDMIYNRVQQDQLLKWHCSDNKRVWFTGHPSNGWFDERVADRIVEFLKANK